MELLSANRLPKPIPRTPSSAIAAGFEFYERKLDRDLEWAMNEGSLFFRGTSDVHKALKNIARRLGEEGIEYAVVGGMAMFQHGYRRFTDDVDLLVTAKGLGQIHRKLEGLGYVPPFTGSKNLRDTENGVKIEFLVTGDFPGDGKPKPIAFPDPASVTEVIDGTNYITLQSLIELKLASGMTNSERMKDLADVMELIKTLELSLAFGETLHPYVREKFGQLWKDAYPPTKRFMSIWRNKWLTAEAKTLEEMISALQSAADSLKSMLADGVFLDPERGASDDYAYLVTFDPTIASKYGMHDEREYLGDADDDEQKR